MFTQYPRRKMGELKTFKRTTLKYIVYSSIRFSNNNHNVMTRARKFMHLHVFFCYTGKHANCDTNNNK